MPSAQDPLRFLYFHPVRLPDAEANVVQAAETCRALAECGQEVFLIVPKLMGESPAACLEVLGLSPHERLHLVEEPAIRLSNTSGLASLWVRLGLLWLLHSLVRRGRTVLYFRTLKDSRLARFLLMASRLLRVPVIYEAHKLYLDKREESGFHSRSLERMERLERGAVTRASAVVASHPLLELALRDRYPAPRKLVTIPNGVRALLAETGATKHDAVYAGSLFPWKGVDICLEALARLEEGTLAVVGGNPLEQLEALKARARELGLEQRVVFYGQLPRRQVFQIVAASRLSLIPLAVGHEEGDRYTCPLKMLEAMALGVPVLAADTPALRSFVTDEQDALLYPPGDVDALARCLNRLRLDQELCQHLRSNGRKLAAEFSYPIRARRVAELARSLIN